MLFPFHAFGLLLIWEQLLRCFLCFLTMSLLRCACQLFWPCLIIFSCLGLGLGYVFSVEIPELSFILLSAPYQEALDVGLPQH